MRTDPQAWPLPDVPAEGPAALAGLPAPCKINTFLHIVGRRSDGYHLLQTPMLLVDWTDELHIERRDDGAIERIDLGAPLPGDDLALRAARALREASGTTFGATIALDKRVPWGAGLGGGSSDAACVLLALNRLWRLDWPRARLAPLALALGADVPFFLDGRPSFVEGIGERLTPLPVRDAGGPMPWLAIVKPPPAVPTADVYRHPMLRRDTEPVILESFARDGSLRSWLDQGFGHNDLQPVAEALCPAVTEALAWLRAWLKRSAPTTSQGAPGRVRMTGSGSAVFAPLGHGPLPAVGWPPEGLPDGWIGRIVRGLERHPLAHWAE